MQATLTVYNYTGKTIGLSVAASGGNVAPLKLGSFAPTKGDPALVKLGTDYYDIYSFAGMDYYGLITNDELAGQLGGYGVFDPYNVVIVVGVAPSTMIDGNAVPVAPPSGAGVIYLKKYNNSFVKMIQDMIVPSDSSYGWIMLLFILIIGVIIGIAICCGKKIIDKYR
jgi:hypothetical protein